MCLSVPAQVLEIFSPKNENEFSTAKVSFGGITKEINLAYVPEAKVGDYVLIHVGFAISLVDPEKAEEVFKTLGDLKAHFQQEDEEKNEIPR
ncbi:MAG TPA: HypC/HybG/HupF family hydrogenase formation chaperone [Pseudobdellovibrionaceae bacterium]|nr:HypC/HybG/HupF family hydrogenase formation chaperone [Pseudobdellovibrionaceae bacterium]